MMPSENFIREKTRFERTSKIEFLRELVEDLTDMEISSLRYFNEIEMYKYVFEGNNLPPLKINVRADSLSAVTRDTIRQTMRYLDEIKDKI